MKTTKMKKISVMVLAMMIVFAMFAGCARDAVDEQGGDTGTVTEVVKVAALNGPTGMAMVKLMDQTDKYEVSTFQAPTDVTGKIISGEVDVAAVPSNLAAVLYNKTEGKVVAVSPIAMGVLHILGNNAGVSEVAELAGKTIVASGQGGTPEYVLQKVLEHAGLTIYEDVQIEWLANHAEVNTKLQTQAGTIAMIPEPFVSTALSTGNAAVSEVFDMNSLWEEATGQGLPMGVLVAQKAFVEEREADLKVLLNDLADSVAFVNEASDEAAAFVAEKGFIGKPEIAKAAIPNCHIVLYMGEDGSELGATILKTFNQTLFEMAPASVGGKLPGEDLYYVGK
ncbi:MAG: ABC transporter substrate-binding protein [Firmicutes bacterium]|nr:ABC transporter substrate-binding protein [Bacillota bacterium]